MDYENPQHIDSLVSVEKKHTSNNQPTRVSKNL